MSSPDEIARGWVAGRGLTPSPSTLALAHRRVCVWGRLAQLAPLLDVKGVVRVDLDEHSDGPPYMATGTAHARIWVAADGDPGVQRVAGEVARIVEATAWPAGLLLTVAVTRARRWDRLVAWWRWRRWMRGATR